MWYTIYYSSDSHYHIYAMLKTTLLCHKEIDNDVPNEEFKLKTEDKYKIYDP
jgi:hypothetical protein